jgi:hypothetical protein
MATNPMFMEGELVHLRTKAADGQIIKVDQQKGFGYHLYHVMIFTTNEVEVCAAYQLEKLISDVWDLQADDVMLEPVDMIMTPVDEEIKPKAPRFATINEDELQDLGLYHSKATNLQTKWGLMFLQVHFLTMVYIYIYIYMHSQIYICLIRNITVNNNSNIELNQAKQ